MKVITWKQFGVIVLIILGLVLAFSPVKNTNSKTVNKNNFLKDIVEKNYLISPEQLGSLIIDKDPEYVLIDIRNEDEYKKFHIKTAINIPIENLLSDEDLEELESEKTIILYSNGETHSSQAWILLKENGFENIYILSGGLNYYVDVYTNPNPPKGVYSDSEIFRYQFLVSAGKNLLGQVDTNVSQKTEIKPKKIKPIRRKSKKKKVVDEGC